MKKKLMTLCCIHDDSRILLGMKKRGFGAGRWNGFGGKMHEGETIEQAARRETKEEAGIEIENLNQRGVLTFVSENNPEELEVHIFSSNNFKGEPTETEEMRPQWFLFDKIPYDSMWADDPLWLPLLLGGKKFEGKFLFDSDGKKILEYELKEI